MTRGFLIDALPRSRTAWLAGFLSYGEWICAHERAVTFRSAAAMAEFLKMPFIGSVETGISPAWQLVDAMVPGLRRVVILRPIDEVIESCRRIDISSIGHYDFDLLRRNLGYMHRCLLELAGMPGVLALTFADLDTEDGCRRLFEHCLPYPFDRAWWLSWKERNVQVDVIGHLRYCLAHRAEIDGLKRDCRKALRGLARAGAFA